MAEYGVTDKGFVLKRLDTILEDVHSKLSEGFGYNTRLYSTTFLNSLVTSFCGEIAELWEEAQNTYYSLYPSSAEGINLDNAVQFSGITRAEAQKSRYRIHCTGDDGTYVSSSTIASDTMPQILLDASEAFTISRSDFHELSIKIVSVAEGDYTVTIDGVSYEVTAAAGDDSESILETLAAALAEAPDVTCTLSDGVIVIAYDEVYQSGVCELSNNLTTGYVVTIAEYSTQDYGSIDIPNTVINTIITNTPGLTSVINLISPTLGREKETDAELRQSNIAKSAIRANTMVDSITSYLLNNIDGIESAAGYENYTDEYDEEGRPPHCIEIIVDGGDDEEIAEAILVKKSGGIRAYGSTTVPVLTENGDTINIGFSRPEYVYAWMHVELTGSNIPSNAAQTVMDTIEAVGDGSVGESIYLQEYYASLYQAISGLTYVSIMAGTTSSASDEAPEYTLQNIIAGYREKIMVSGDRIEVVVNDS